MLTFALDVLSFSYFLKDISLKTTISILTRRFGMCPQMNGGGKQIYTTGSFELSEITFTLGAFFENF